jgi:hypothetical protein
MIACNCHPATVRRALVEAPENVATLVRVITSRLFNLVSDHTFPSAPTTKYAVTSFASSLIKGGGGGASAERNATKEVLNCLRVLQRVLPVIFELESEPSVFEREVLWKRDVVVVSGEGEGEDEGAGGQSHREQMEQTTQFVIEDEEDDEDDAESGGASAPASAVGPSPQIPPKQTTTTLPSIAERLFSCLVDLLFCCGFTIPAKLQVDHYKISYVIW